MHTLACLWPDGVFALPKSTSGCPCGSIGEGSVYQDNEDYSNLNSRSSPFSVSGGFGINTRTDYCTFLSFSLLSWPSGTYCIVKFGGSCPSGFEEGYVFWDDEDNNNDDYVSGSVPYSIVGNNARLYYCCRSDGSISTPITLPTGTPFYLLQKSSGWLSTCGWIDKSK